MKQNKRLHIIMPMAGEGNRFKDKGYTTPKPLIKLHDKELYKWALDSFEDLDKTDLEIQYTFIIRRDMDVVDSVMKAIKESYPNANIITVEKTTRGALETCMLANKYIFDWDNVVILDCDVSFRCPKYMRLIHHHIMNDMNEPLLLGFYSHDPKYSYAEYDPDNTYYLNTMPMLRTAEKDPISNCALAGCYFVGNGKTFKERSEYVLKSFELGEIKSKEVYVSLLYNYMKDLSPRICPMSPYYDKLYSLGTPEDLERFSYDKSIWDY